MKAYNVSYKTYMKGGDKMNTEDKLRYELTEIMNRIIKLMKFQKTEEFNKLSNEMQNLLIAQQSAMNTYCCILQARIELIEKEGE